MADRGGVTTVAEGQGTSVGPVSQRAGGSSARGRSASRSPAKDDAYLLTGWRSTCKVLIEANIGNQRQSEAIPCDLLTRCRRSRPRARRRAHSRVERSRVHSRRHSQLSSSQLSSSQLSSSQLSSSQPTSFTSLPSFNMSLTSRARAWRVLVVSPGASRAGELLGTSGAVVAFALGVAAGAVTKRGKLCVERNARLV